jgi:hypothetical protein
MYRCSRWLPWHLCGWWHRIGSTTRPGGRSSGCGALDLEWADVVHAWLTQRSMFSDSVNVLSGGSSTIAIPGSVLVLDDGRLKKGFLARAGAKTDLRQHFTTSLLRNSTAPIQWAMVGISCVLYVDESLPKRQLIEKTPRAGTRSAEGCEDVVRRLYSPPFNTLLPVSYVTLLDDNSGLRYRWCRLN